MNNSQYYSSVAETFLAERSVGSIFHYKDENHDVDLEVLSDNEAQGCTKCHFWDKDKGACYFYLMSQKGFQRKYGVGFCSKYNRVDGKNIRFRKLVDVSLDGQGIWSKVKNFINKIL